MFGRSVIYTDAEYIDENNVTEVLNDALTIHDKNRRDIQHLYDVFCGKHEILAKVKDVRPEINNKIVVNYPYRIVRFKTGFQVGDPIQYVSVSGNEKVQQFNRYMKLCDKDTKDISLVEWVYICGVGYKYGMSVDNIKPFEIETLDPRFTFVVFDRKINHNQKMCCTFVEDSEGHATYYVYTDNKYFEIKDGKVIRSEFYFGVRQPIVEYHFNNAYLGAFEPVESMCEAIDRITSDRMDGLDQFVQAFMVFKGVNVDNEDFHNLKKEGAIVVPETGDVKYVISELNQSSTQTLLDNTYQQMLEIVGMPNRNGGYSTSDTGLAVIYRDGWSDASAFAAQDEKMFKKSEREFLSLIVGFYNDLAKEDIDVADIDINFTRKNYENIAQKAEVLTTMLNNPKIHPKLAFIHSDMFTDPETAYKMSDEYYEEYTKRESEALNREITDEQL